MKKNSRFKNIFYIKLNKRKYKEEEEEEKMGKTNKSVDETRVSERTTPDKFNVLCGIYNSIKCEINNAKLSVFA